MVIAGGIIVLVGIVFWLFSDKLGWFGNLPGDIKVEKENFRIYVPLGTMLLISIVLSIIIYIINKLFR